MVSGNGYDRHLTLSLRNKSREGDGKCTFCSPHGGENRSRATSGKSKTRK